MPANLQGLDALLRQLSGLENQITSIVEEETRKTAEAMVQTARELAPVASGRLRDSIQAVQQVGGFWKVGTDVPYAAAKELGVRNAPAKPFLFPAYLAHKAELLQNLKTALRTA